MYERGLKYLSKYNFGVFALSIIWYIFLFKGFREFFVELGIAPAETIAELVGALLIPIALSYGLARLFAKGNSYKIFGFWISGLSIILIISTLGKLNGEYKWW